LIIRLSGFSIREKTGVQITYEVIREDGTIAEILAKVNALYCFSVFLSYCGGNQNREELKDKIVVIDDPVSGMDGSALLL
jgi:wobble nucleotide-excising tRNase